MATALAHFPCLIAENSKYRNIYLDRDVVTIGRGLEHNVSIPSAVISRNHATISKVGRDYVIVDDCSLNGVFVNDLKVNLGERLLLNDGDKVSFGMKRGEDDFIYVYHNGAERALKRKSAGKEPVVSIGSKKIKPNIQAESILEKKLLLERKVNTLELRLAEKDKAKNALEDELSVTKFSKLLMTQCLNDILDIVNLKEDPKKCNQSSLKERVDYNYSQWVNDRELVEAVLQSKDISKSKYMMLMSQKNSLDKIIGSRDVQMKLFHEATDTDVAKTTERQNALREFNDLVEAELQCSICSELFIEPVTLNCSHTFCLKCIQDWMTRKNKNAECPICRVNITTHVRSCVLDSFIDNFVELFSPEQKDRRKQLLGERSVHKRSRRSSTVTSASSYLSPWTSRQRRHSLNPRSHPGLVSYDPIVLQDSD